MAIKKGIFFSESEWFEYIINQSRRLGNTDSDQRLLKSRIRTQYPNARICNPGTATVVGVVVATHLENN